jgi:anti-anti-sigma regulatory factor
MVRTSFPRQNTFGDLSAGNIVSEPAYATDEEEAMLKTLTLNPHRSASRTSSTLRVKRPSQNADVPRTPVVAVIGAPSVRDPLNLNLPVFGTELDEAIAAGATRLIVDLSEDPVGSLALNALLRARQQLGRRGRIALIVSPRLRRFCAAAGLDRRFLLADDYGQATRLLGIGLVGTQGVAARGHRRSDPAFDRGGRRAA